MKRELEKIIKQAANEVFGEDLAVELTRPEEKFGDYSTNIALKLAGKLQKKPSELASQLMPVIKKRADIIAGVEIAGPGFLNLRLSEEALWESANSGPEMLLQGKTIVAEYSDPSSFKVLHAGHLYTSLVGDAVANTLEAVGGIVHRVNFGGDIGLHVAKTIWSILRTLGGEFPDKLADIPEAERPDWMSQRYVEGNLAYEDDPSSKSAITDLNKRLYGLHAQNDHESAFAKIYWTCRQWSYDYFEQFYDRIGSHFDKYYPESMTMPVGVETVMEQLDKGVYQRSDGAIIFPGETYGLHTRVFINSQGLPTYETKDVGLIMMKWHDYHYDMSIILTDATQAQYMAVVLKSVEQFAPELAKTTTHITHGRVKLAGGVKMSSRLGNFVRAVDVLDAAAEANKKLTGQDNQQTVLGAVKYAFLRTRLGADVIYEPDESVSLEGNSGPYLQYAHARACSIMEKKSPQVAVEQQPIGLNLQPAERSLLRKISEYPEVVNQAAAELLPHYICTYLYELCQNFNAFYEQCRVIGDDREALRIQLVNKYAAVLKDGLKLLGIAAPTHI